MREDGKKAEYIENIHHHQRPSNDVLTNRLYMYPHTLLSVKRPKLVFHLCVEREGECVQVREGGRRVTDRTVAFFLPRFFFSFSSLCSSPFASLPLCYNLPHCWIYTGQLYPSIVRHCLYCVPSNSLKEHRSFSSSFVVLHYDLVQNWASLLHRRTSVVSELGDNDRKLWSLQQRALKICSNEHWTFVRGRWRIEFGWNINLHLLHWRKHLAIHRYSPS